jgi:adenylate kinase family enzyme
VFEVKIQVCGFSASGKSTFSKALAKYYNTKVLHLDTLHFGPNWEIIPDTEMAKKIDEFLDKNDSWVIDGNYIDSLDIRLEKADLVIMLDIDLKTCIKSIVIRTIKGYFIKRKDLAEGCSDKFDESKKNLISWRYASRVMGRTLPFR